MEEKALKLQTHDSAVAFYSPASRLEGRPRPQFTNDINQSSCLTACINRLELYSSQSRTSICGRRVLDTAAVNLENGNFLPEIFALKSARKHAKGRFVSLMV